MPPQKSPRILVTLAVVAEQSQSDLAERRAELYLEAVRRHGGDPVAVDARTAPAGLATALANMDGLLLSGGGDLDPARYGQPNLGSLDIQPERDELEATAWKEATARGIPVLGICRGLQAINVFSGGSLVQHVDGHAGPGWGAGDPATHPIRVVPGTRLGDLLDAGRTAESDPDPAPLVVNAYHHQGVRERDLAPGLVAAAWADSSAGPLVEGLEASGSRFVVGVQCHPERTESTPAAFERVFEAFVSAARSARDVQELPGPDPDEITSWITTTYPETIIAEAMGATFFSLDEKHWRNFATIVTTDEHDMGTTSNLARDGVFRLSIGVGRETFQRLVGSMKDPDYAALDRVLLHPVYARQRWLAILNPSRQTFDDIVKPLIVEAYQRIASQSRGLAVSSGCTRTTPRP